MDDTSSLADREPARGDGSLAENHELSDLQLEIMRVLWDQGEASVSQVQEDLPRRLAITTVATLLKRLAKRGLVAFRSSGRQHLYRALLSEERARARDLHDLRRRWFRGDMRELVSHLLGDGEVGRDELQELQRLVAARLREDGEAPPR